MDDKIKVLVDMAYPTSYIASAVGMNQQVVARRIRELGLVPPSRSYSGWAYGITTNSVPLRAMLASILVDMREAGMLQPDISAATGLNAREISKAAVAPYTHDWKLSQIERTLQQAGKTINAITG